MLAGALKTSVQAALPATLQRGGGQLLASLRPRRALPSQFFSFRALAAVSPQRIAVVTGGARGLGEAISRALADGGDRVVVADVLEKEGRVVAGSIGGEFVHCDITDSASVRSLMEGVAARHGSLDVVVANAGIAPVPTATHAIEEDVWDQMQKVNGFGTFVTCKYALRQMLKQSHGGVLLGMSSVCGMTGHGGTAHYNFTKAGVISLTKTIAIEYRKRNIRMNCILPNTTDTPLVKEFMKHVPPAVQEQMLQLSPIPGLIQPPHVGQAAAMLCAPNKYLTGVALPLDGGYLAAAPTYKVSDFVELAEQK